MGGPAGNPGMGGMAPTNRPGMDASIQDSLTYTYTLGNTINTFGGIR